MKQSIESQVIRTEYLGIRTKKSIYRLRDECDHCPGAAGCAGRIETGAAPDIV